MKIGGFFVACLSVLILSACASVEAPKTDKDLPPPAGVTTQDKVQNTPSLDAPEPDKGITPPSVDVTKTSQGVNPPTEASSIEIITTKPDFNYIELGIISADKHKPSQAARLLNSLRVKAAPLGATHVLLLNKGIDNDGHLWAKGLLIKKE